MIQLVLVLLLLAPFSSLKAESDFIVMGTGDLTGVYYPAGGAICRLLNRERARHDIRCAVESTQGSTYNLRALERGELDLAIVQPDWLHHAVKGSSIFISQGANEDLRTLFNLHSEALTIVARKDSGIVSFDDLKGRRVNLGSPQSGQRRTMDLILDTLGWRYNAFEVASELSASEMSEALCSGKIDAFIYIVGHPNASVAEATTFCDSRIIPLPESLIEKFSAKYPFYSAGSINGALYKGNPDPIPTLTLRARLVATKGMSQATAFELGKVIYLNFNLFREMHPALKGLSRSQVFDFSSSLAPVHPGIELFMQRSGEYHSRENR